MSTRSLTLACGAVLTVEHYNDYSLFAPARRMYVSLHNLPVTGHEQAELIMRRPGATGSATLEYGIHDEEMLLRRLEITEAEGAAIVGGTDPIEALLPPGRITVVPVNMGEFL
jgi:hypothetical protein